MQGKMFVPRIKGYHTEIIGDHAGTPHQIQVRDRIVKAKAFSIACQAGDEVEVEFTIDGPDAVSKTNAVMVACDKYRYVMGLRAQDHVNCRVTEIKAKIGASA